MLNILSELCDTISHGTLPSQTSNERDNYKAYLEIMDWRIRGRSIPKIGDNSQTALDDTTLMMQLYQLAMLVHLSRSSNGLFDQPLRTQQRAEQAFVIISQLKFCQHQFPIHIIGCEARTDEQRAIVLDVISRTEAMSLSRSFNYCRRILEAVWAQDDLSCGNSFSYHERMTSVMHRCKVAPSWV